MNKWCIAFPGREAVSKRMDSSFYQNYKEVRRLFEEAEDYIKKDITKMCYNSSSIPAEWQTLCLITHCYGIYKVFIDRYGLPDAVAGYSQGEFTACTAAGVFSFPEILELILKLETILQEENKKAECMYRFIDIDTSLLKEICTLVDETGNYVCISSYISDSQTIVSGSRKHVDKVIDLARKYGVRWVIDLKTEVAFHSPLCNTIRDKAEVYFIKQKLYQATCPVYSCLDGKKSIVNTIICRKLSKQINHPIQWRTIVKNMVDSGLITMYELGPGCTVSSNSRIADDRLHCRWIGSSNEL